MPSHLNAYNMSPSASALDVPQCPKWRKAIYGLIGVAAFVLIDRASLLMVPEQYRSIPDDRRYHTLYYSMKLGAFREIADRATLVVLGDSRARHGVDPKYLQAQRAEDPVTAFNLAPASSGVAFTELLIGEYLLDLPRLRTVVWGLSPRIFNRYWQDPIHDMFEQSQGFQADRLAARAQWSRRGLGPAARLAFGRIMTSLSATYGHRSLIKSSVLDSLGLTPEDQRFSPEPPILMNRWGFMAFPDERRVDLSNPAIVQRYLDPLESGRFEFAEDRFSRLKGIIGRLDRHGIALLCFVPPMHPSLASSPAADADGTPARDYANLMMRLTALEREFPNFSFLDIHHAGDNRFSDDEFGDLDHVVGAGSRRLTAILADRLRLAPRRRGVPSETVLVAAESADVGPAPKQGRSTAAVSTPTSGPGHDVTPPTIVGHLGELDFAIRTYPPDNRPELWAEFDDTGSGVLLSSVRFFMDGEDLTQQCLIHGNRITYKPAKTLEAPQLYSFKVVAKDRAGNPSELVWEILLKPC